jgi:hypothetical protein
MHAVTVQVRDHWHVIARAVVWRDRLQVFGTGAVRESRLLLSSTGAVVPPGAYFSR